MGKNSQSRPRTAEELKAWNQAQSEEALSDDNRWFAGEALGHKPTDSEAMLHYVKSGGAAQFAAKHQAVND